MNKKSSLSDKKLGFGSFGPKFLEFFGKTTVKFQIVNKMARSGHDLEVDP